VTACAGGDEERVIPPVVVGMTPNVAPFYDDGETQLYMVQNQVRLPVRRSTDEERAALPRGIAPYGRQPFLLDSDLRLEIRFTLSNLDDEQRIVELLVDPWNEFVRYRPGVQAGDEEAIPNFSGFQRFFVIPPKSRIEGVITPDDMRELAIDLATAQQIMSAPPPANAIDEDPRTGLINRAFNLQNRSNQEDLLVKPHIPAVIAGLTGFDIGLRASQPGNVALESIIDVKDLNGERLVELSSGDPEIGVPGRVLTPPGAR
jgi:hypothetical protein